MLLARVEWAKRIQNEHAGRQILGNENNGRKRGETSFWLKARYPRSQRMNHCFLPKISSRVPHFLLLNNINTCGLENIYLLQPRILTDVVERNDQRAGQIYAGDDLLMRRGTYDCCVWIHLNVIVASSGGPFSSRLKRSHFTTRDERKSRNQQQPTIPNG